MRLPALQSQSQPEEEDEAEEDESEELGHTEVYADYVPSKCECRSCPCPCPCMPGDPQTTGRRPAQPRPASGLLQGAQPLVPWSSTDGPGGAVRSPWSGCNRTVHRPEVAAGDGK